MRDGTWFQRKRLIHLDTSGCRSKLSGNFEHDKNLENILKVNERTNSMVKQNFSSYPRRIKYNKKYFTLSSPISRSIPQYYHDKQRCSKILCWKITRPLRVKTLRPVFQGNSFGPFRESLRWTSLPWKLRSSWSFVERTTWV